MMHLRAILWLLLLIGALSCVAASRSSLPPHGNDTLSRTKRFVAFPEGSSLSVSICLTTGVLGNPNVAFLSWAENWGVAYNLPNYTWVKQHANGFKSDGQLSQGAVKRRSRRDLYEKVESIIDSMGFRGRACVERALCESSKYWSATQKGQGNMLEEIVKEIFSFPTDMLQPHEAEEMQHYGNVYRRGRRDVIDCAYAYRECHFSLLELAFGKYTMAPTKHGPLAIPLKAVTFM